MARQRIHIALLTGPAASGTCSCCSGKQYLPQVVAGEVLADALQPVPQRRVVGVDVQAHRECLHATDSAWKAQVGHVTERAFLSV